MQGKWVVYKNHIAFDTEKEMFHPNAEEIFSFVSGEGSLNIQNPIEELKNIRFSKIGSPLKCEIFIDSSDNISLELFVIRKNKKYFVDVIDGNIIDHCVNDKEWFYVNGNVYYVQQLLTNAKIKECGKITIAQYLELIKQESFSENKEIKNNVDVEKLSKIMIPRGDVPKGIKATLYNYQKEGFLWMRNMLDLSRGCILGDEMGLGKTLQVITLFQEMKHTKRMPVLVISPVSLLENWKRECERFTPDLDVFIHHGAKRSGRAKELENHDVVVISYNTAVSDLSMLKMIDWHCVVLDEAQNIKNPDSERTKSVKAIKRKAGIAVSGTPFENHITDIWSLVDFSIPGLLGSLKDFQSNIADDISGAEKIEPVLSPIMIRRLVKDVANDLPEKVVVSQPLRMTENEAQRYETYRNEAKSSTEKGSALTLAILQKLRMYCTHPNLCENDGFVDPANVSIKYQRFCELVEEIIEKKEKVLVFTSYKNMFDIFKKDIPNRFGIEIDTINGETPVEERQKIVDWFNNYDGPAMLALNPRAAGTGLNITGANHVIHYNLEWNPSLEDQSSARAYRRGQKKTVFIYRLFYLDTVEEIVNDRIERKREIAKTAIIGTDGVEDKNDILRALELAPKLHLKG